MRKQSGQTLVATLVVLMIIAILAVVLWGRAPGSSGSTRADGKGKTTLGSAMASAKDTECRSNLGQVRQAIQLRQTLDEEPIQDLRELRLGEAFTRCPLGKEPYVVDPATGAVRCVHPGHEKY